MRLKHATPSAAGSAASIASIRAIASATEATGASGTGAVIDMAVTIGRPSEFWWRRVVAARKMRGSSMPFTMITKKKLPVAATDEFLRTKPTRQFTIEVTVDL
jgi:hypothetical protein